METPSIEIILLNLPADCVVSMPCYNRFAGRLAPLGLFCLAAVAPERVTVVDTANTQQMFDMLAEIPASPVKSIICQISPATDAVKLARLCSQLHTMFAGARIGCNSETFEFPACFDFAVMGTGKSAVLRILRGDNLVGVVDSRHDDFASPLPVPQELLIDCGYDILPEKWLHARTLEIFQPWLGLLEQSIILRTYPGIDWLASLFTWLQRSGFSAFHLRPSGLTSENLHELRSLMLNIRARFAVSFAASDKLNIRQIGVPLQQVWLYHPTAAQASEIREKLRQIRDAGFQSGLQVDIHWLESNPPQQLLNLVDRLAISDEGLWAFSDLKRLVSHFWGGKNRFFMRLFGIRSASELVMFMKTSYMILEILFTSEKAGRC